MKQSFFKLSIFLITCLVAVGNLKATNYTARVLPEGVFRFRYIVATDLGGVTHRLNEHGKKERITENFNTILSPSFFGSLESDVHQLNKLYKEMTANNGGEPDLNYTDPSVDLQLDGTFTFLKQVFAFEMGVTEDITMAFAFSLYDYKINLDHKQAVFLDGDFFKTAKEKLLYPEGHPKAGKAVITGSWDENCLMDKQNPKCTKDENSKHKAEIEEALQQVLTGKLKYNRFDTYEESGFAGWIFGGKWKFYDENDLRLGTKIIWNNGNIDGAKDYKNLLDKSLGQPWQAVDFGLYGDYIFNENVTFTFIWLHNFNFNYTHKDLRPFPDPNKVSIQTWNENPVKDKDGVVIGNKPIDVEIKVGDVDRLLLAVNLGFIDAKPLPGNKASSVEGKKAVEFTPFIIWHHKGEDTTDATYTRLIGEPGSKKEVTQKVQTMLAETEQQMIIAGIDAEVNFLFLTGTKLTPFALEFSVLRTAIGGEDMFRNFGNVPFLTAAIAQFKLYAKFW